MAVLLDGFGIRPTQLTRFGNGAATFGLNFNEAGACGLEDARIRQRDNVGEKGP